MVQIIQENREPSFSERFARGFGNASRSLAEDIPQHLMGKRQGQAVARLTGEDVEDLPPELQQEFAKKFIQNKYTKELEELKSNKDQAKKLEDQYLDEKSYEKIEQTFGKKFADIWKAAPIGGRTELLKHGMDAKLRGANLEEMLGGIEVPEDFLNQEPIEIPQIEKGKIAKDFKWPDYTKPPVGYTPKDWKDERKTWRKENSPIFLETKARSSHNKRDAVAIKKLGNLNETRKVAEGFERTLINPESGEPYGLAQLTNQMSPETQEWIKEIARFQNRAKDAFGSRVTNFDLVSYMKQFPGLMNTYEGRRRILGMMKINNELDQIYDNAIQDIYKKYGLNGIPHEEADRLATSMIKDRTEQLENEYLGLDEENIMDEEKQLSGRMIDVVGPDGQEYEVDESEVNQLPEGYRII